MSNQTPNDSSMSALILSLRHTTINRPSPSPWRPKDPGYAVPLLKLPDQPNSREPVPSEEPAPLAERLPSRSSRWRTKVKGQVSRLASRIARGLGSRLKQLDQVSQPETTARVGSSQDQGIAAGPRVKPGTTFKLLQLPEELLLQIMGHLPQGNVYILRQICQTLRRITEDATLGGFKFDFLRPENAASFMTRAGLEQHWIARELLARDSLCDACKRVAETGALLEKMAELYEPVHCSRCKKAHAALFFAPSQRRPKRRGRRGGLCLGQLGRLAVCPHVSLSWKYIDKLRRVGGTDKVNCKHGSHVPEHRLVRGHHHLDENDSPHARPYRSVLGSIRLPVYRTFYLLQLDHRFDISIDDIRQGLREAARTLPGGQQLCKHVSAGSDQALDCLASDDCACFPTSGLARYPATGHSDCFCRRHTFECRHCGAVYTWTREPDWHDPAGSYISLRMHTSSWLIDSPCSPAWLSNVDLDQRLFGDAASRRNGSPVLGQDTRHVLWCDSPGCGTGSGLRWLRMARTYNAGGIWWMHHRGQSVEGVCSVSLEYEAFDRCRFKNRPGWWVDEMGLG